MTERPRLGRVLLKVSGEILGGQGSGIEHGMVEAFAAELEEAKETGAEIAVVIGGGNILRGEMMCRQGIKKVAADYMGMLGTIINALALQSALEDRGVDARVMTAIVMEHFVEPYVWRNAVRHLDEGRIVIFAGGTGNPFFTTDTAAALRACETEAEALLKGTKVDGVYTADPMTDRSAERIGEMGYTDVLRRDLRVMDATAVALCRDNQIPVIVFDLFEKGNLRRVIEGEALGTIIR
ncbi:MAG: UMP kinase [Candidatus Krumholzibacteriota bacterium]|nr:UMP kinase [Candidatus Krumholzibacteriota bacterium]